MQEVYWMNACIIEINTGKIIHFTPLIPRFVDVGILPNKHRSHATMPRISGKFQNGFFGVLVGFSRVINFIEHIQTERGCLVGRQSMVAIAVQHFERVSGCVVGS